MKKHPDPTAPGGLPDDAPTPEPVPRAPDGPAVAAVTVGRGEGERLLRCLDALTGKALPIVYVDSGSKDGSPEAALARGAHVIELDPAKAFTASRGRNAGLALLRDIDPDGTYVQMLDGDCEIVDGWIETAHAFLEANPEIAAVTGRRRERFPEASIWNRLMDDEWNGPEGEVSSCGGDVMIRRAAIEAVGGYNSDLIAGEDPEMYFRMHRNGWRFWRLDVEMSRHDANLTKFSEWWKRNKRGGYGFAESERLHRGSPQRYRLKEMLRALVWALVPPAVAILGAAIVSPWMLAVLLVYPLQVLRLWRSMPLRNAFFLTLGKFPEAHGILEFHLTKQDKAQRDRIEYK